MQPNDSRRRLYTALSIVVTLCIPVLLGLVSVRLVMTNLYLQVEYTRPDFPTDVYGFSVLDRLHYAPFTLDYLLTGAGIDYLANLVQPNGQPFYNERELDHMVDVKRVVKVAFGVLGIVILALAIIGMRLVPSEEGRQALRRGLFSGGLLTLLILAGLLVFMLTYWDQAFIDFHSLFFAEGTWVFNYSDSLIRLFPVRFWQDAGIAVGLMSGTGALVIMGLSWLWAQRVNRRRVLRKANVESAM